MFEGPLLLTVFATANSIESLIQAGKRLQVTLSFPMGCPRPSAHCSPLKPFRFSAMFPLEMRDVCRLASRDVTPKFSAGQPLCSSSLYLRGGSGLQWAAQQIDVQAGVSNLTFPYFDTPLLVTIRCSRTVSSFLSHFWFVETKESFPVAVEHELNVIMSVINSERCVLSSVLKLFLRTIDLVDGS